MSRVNVGTAAALGLGCLILLAAPQPLAHADPAQPTAAPLPLALAACLKRTLDHNLGLQELRLQRRRAGLAQDWERRIYFPTFYVEAGWVDSQAPALSTYQGVDEVNERSVAYDAGVAVRTPIGSELGVSLSNTRRSTNDLSAVYDPEHHNVVALHLTQPLLQGFGLTVTTADLQLARLEYQAAVQRFRLRLDALLAAVERSYWALYLAHQDLSIKTRSVERARQQYEQTRTNIERGLLAEPEILVVEENLVRFEGQRRQAEQRVVAAGAALWQLVQSSEEAKGPAPRLAPTDAPPAPPGQLPTGPVAIDTLRTTSPELLIAGLAVLSAELGAAKARDGERPRLDLVAAVELEGTETGLSDSLGQVSGADNRELSVGLRLQWPVFNWFHAPLAELAAADVASAKAAAQRVEQELVGRVRVAHAELSNASDQLGYARRIRELAERKLAAEQEKYSRGLSTLTDLVLFQRELDVAEIDEQEATVAVALRTLELAQLQGKVSERAGIVVQP